MGFFSGFKHVFGFGNPSLGASQQLADINPTTGYAMIPGTLHDVGGNNIGATLSSDFDDPFNSVGMAQPFDLGFGSSDFDSF
jgi:hypothetical protein